MVKCLQVVVLLLRGFLKCSVVLNWYRGLVFREIGFEHRQNCPQVHSHFIMTGPSQYNV